MVKIVNQTTMFLLEIAILVVFGYYGMSRDWELLPRFLLTTGMIGIAIYLWSVVAAPTSKKRFRMPYLVIFRTAMFLIASLLLFLAGQKHYALILAVLSIVNQTISFFTEK